MNKFRKSRIRKAIFSKKYGILFILFFLAYISLTFFLNEWHITYRNLLSYNLYIILPIILFTLFVGFLVALNINLIIMKFKEYKEVNKHSGITGVGAFFGLIGGACPGCFAGLFPAFLGLFGVTATLGNLPLYGIEIQAFSAILLIISTNLLTRPNICKK